MPQRARPWGLSLEEGVVPEGADSAGCTDEHRHAWRSDALSRRELDLLVCRATALG